MSGDSDCLSFLFSTVGDSCGVLPFRMALEFVSPLRRRAQVPTLTPSLQPGLEPSLVNREHGEQEREAQRYHAAWYGDLWMS